METEVKSRPRRKRGSLSREEIVDAALALADGTGLAGLTMPALAARLGCGVMTLYGYVRGKDELLEEIGQRGIADLSLPRPLAPDAEGVLIAWGRAMRTTLLHHPALPAIYLNQPVVGPGILRGVEALLGALASRGYEPQAGVGAIYAVLVYTIGFVAWELPRTVGGPEPYAAAWRQVVAGLSPTAAYPLTSAHVDALTKVAAEAQFELGLCALAAGLARGTADRPEGPAAASEPTPTP
jgi:TetR/AcrR family tetracycline transcriptional repressor